MSVDIRQGADGSLEMVGAATTSTVSGTGFIPVTLPYTATIVDCTMFTADRPVVVKGIRGRVDVAGTGGACTATIRKVPSGTALTSGTALHSGTFNLVGTAAAQQSLTLSTTGSDLLLAVGDSICFDLTGTPTSAVGAITVHLAPA